MTRIWQRFRSRRGYLSVCSLVCIVSAVSGCGGDATPAPASQTVPEPAPTEPTTPAGTSAPTTEPTAETTDPRSKTKWVGDIPYDVFYDQPLAVAAENATLAPATLDRPIPEPEAPDTTSPVSSLPASASATTGGSPDWKRLASAEVLNDEVKRLRNALTANLNTLATYNRNLDAIVNDGATLAALAAVVEQHSDRISWTDNAKFVRDLAHEVSIRADGSGRGPYDATTQPFEQIVGILNGGPPPDRDASDKVPFADVADRSELMKRIKKSFDYLKAEVNTEARFKELPEDVIRGASVLASFGGMISTDSYDYHDEQQYQQFVTDFIQANVDMATSAATDDFARFEQSRDRVQNACNACHGEYAFGDEGF